MKLERQKTTHLFQFYMFWGWIFKHCYTVKVKLYERSLWYKKKKMTRNTKALTNTETPTYTVFLWRNNARSKFHPKKSKYKKGKELKNKHGWWTNLPRYSTTPTAPKASEKQSNTSPTELKLQLSLSAYCNQASTVFPWATEFPTFFCCSAFSTGQHLMKGQLITTYRSLHWRWGARKSLGRTI